MHESNFSPWPSHHEYTLSASHILRVDTCHFASGCGQVTGHADASLTIAGTPNGRGSRGWPPARPRQPHPLHKHVFCHMTSDCNGTIGPNVRNDQMCTNLSRFSQRHPLIMPITPETSSGRGSGGWPPARPRQPHPLHKYAFRHSASDCYLRFANDVCLSTGNTTHESRRENYCCPRVGITNPGALKHHLQFIMFV